MLKLIALLILGAFVVVALHNDANAEAAVLAFIADVRS